MQKIPGAIALMFLLGCTGKKSGNPEAFIPGFKTIHTSDTTRIYKHGTSVTDQLHYRPLDLDIWYPADSSTNDTDLPVDQ
ncbi:hypothetical protein LZZ85_17195 [Terrimonas sp. NA20]|uniref:Uncharacterized protein n=1 Tax=Terrimonas ginsenosidimutans TaxID=2908004 RepID=A0ABS9KUM0_9BACT|nr:hypothetical protein [Terrimonas ginsenosidimutans]MCG2616036.1 hypothetical protein [Terrimonas ginsenosidimutans]